MDFRRIGSLSCLLFDLERTGASRITDPDRLPGTLMHHYLSVLTDAAGVVHIGCQTGVMFSEQEDLNPVLKQHAKNYLIDEGFFEQALGTLEPLPDREIDCFFGRQGRYRHPSFARPEPIAAASD